MRTGAPTSIEVEVVLCAPSLGLWLAMPGHGSLT